MSKEFIKDVYEIAFGADAYDKDFSEEDVLGVLRERSAKAMRYDNDSTIIISGNPIEGFSYIGPMNLAEGKIMYEHLGEGIRQEPDLWMGHIIREFNVPVPIEELDPEELPF